LSAEKLFPANAEEKMRTAVLSAVVLALLAGALLAQDEVVFKNYNLKHVKLSDAGVRQKLDTELRKVLSKSGRLIFDDRSNAIFVQDRESNQNKIAQIVAKIDVPSKEATKTATITVRVTNVEASVAKKAIEEAAQEDKELAGLKSSHSDQTGTIILTGKPAQLDKARKLIEALEKKFSSDIVTKVYKVKNRSAESLASIVKLHLPEAPGTGVAIDELTNSLIVRETKSNQEKVRQVVAKFDTELATLLLEFRVIYASHQGNVIDEGVKDVVKELQKLFIFTSYRSHEAPVVKVEQGHSAAVIDTASGLSVSLKRCGYDPETKKIRIEKLEVSKSVEKGGDKPTVFTIKTTITTDAGHTVVIGGAKSKDSKEALIVVLKAELAK
jgi:type II secretory pathway component HofQ